MFTLHPQLAADTFEIAALPLCRVLLMNNRLFPWLILVPRRDCISEILQLSQAEQHQLMDEIARASEALTALCAPHKLNVAALGNMVPQLHVHVVARFREDAAWPQPVWGKGGEPYLPEQRESLIAVLQKMLHSE